MKKYFCDACGEETLYEPIKVNFSRNQTLDLCNKCFEELILDIEAAKINFYNSKVKRVNK